MKKVMIFMCLVTGLLFASCDKKKDTIVPVQQTQSANAPVVNPTVASTKQDIIDYLDEYGFITLDITPKPNTIADWVGVIKDKTTNKVYMTTVYMTLKDGTWQIVDHVNKFLY